MSNKPSVQKEFEKYWKKYINEVIRRKLEFVINGHQKEILKFRKKWEIPTEGFKNNRSYNKWLKVRENAFKRGRQLVYEHVGEVPIPTVMFNLFLPKKVVPKKSDIHAVKLGKDFFYYFGQRVLELCVEINMDPAWIAPFEYYVLTDTLDMKKMGYTPVEISEKINYSHSGKEIGRKACLTFGPNTRLKDIILMWKWQVKPLLESLPGYMKNPPRKKRNKS